MYGLKDSEIRLIQNILNEYDVKKAIIYGSRARGDFRQGSDIDMVLFGENLKKKLFYIYDKLEEELPYLIDISLYENITNEKLKEHIANIGKIIYQR